MRKDVLQSICQLERVDISETVLDVGVDHKLRETEDFTAQVERVSETRLLSLFRSQRP